MTDDQVREITPYELNYRVVFSATEVQKVVETKTPEVQTLYFKIFSDEFLSLSISERLAAIQRWAELVEQATSLGLVAEAPVPK